MRGSKAGPGVALWWAGGHCAVNGRCPSSRASGSQSWSTKKLNLACLWWWEMSFFLSSQVKFISQNHPASQNTCISGPIGTRRLEASCRRPDPWNEGRGLRALKFRQARNIWTKDKMWECLLGVTLMPKTHTYKEKLTAISCLCNRQGMRCLEILIPASVRGETEPSHKGHF